MHRGKNTGIISMDLEKIFVCVFPEILSTCMCGRNQNKLSILRGLIFTTSSIPTTDRIVLWSVMVYSILSVLANGQYYRFLCVCLFISVCVCLSVDMQAPLHVMLLNACIFERALGSTAGDTIIENMTRILVKWNSTTKITSSWNRDVGH